MWVHGGFCGNLREKKKKILEGRDVISNALSARDRRACNDTQSVEGMASGSAQPLPSTVTVQASQLSKSSSFASPIEPNGVSSSKAASATPAPTVPVKQPVYKGRTPRNYIPGISLVQKDVELASSAFDRYASVCIVCTFCTQEFFV